MRRVLLATLIVMLAAGGCVKSRPKTTPRAASPLDVPAPPPRVVAPPEPEQPAEETTPDPPDPGKKSPPSPSPRPRGETAKPVEAKPEPPPVEVPKPPAAPTGAPLQPELKATPQEVTRQVEVQLAQARKDLDKVNYQGLGADARSQYDSAKQFITQAAAALKEGNFVFAVKLAEKAVGLASNLAPR